MMPEPADVPPSWVGEIGRSVHPMTDIDHPAVLVVEDERDLADMYAEWLEEEYEVRVTYDGETALELVDETVDVVLLDRLMPGLSGDDVLAEIEGRDYDPLVAMITAVEPDFDVLSMGFDDYLVKPVFADDLRATVERLLSRATYDDRLQRYFALVSKRAAIEEYRSIDEAESNREYAELSAEIEELKSDLDETIATFDDATFQAVFRAMDRPSVENS